MKTNIFVDMDGVLAVYDKDIVNHMYTEGYFANRPAIKPMLEIVRRLADRKDYNIYILTSCIDSPYCIPEKASWLDKNLPKINVENRIYVPYGTVKSEFAKMNVDVEDSINVLIDDYTENLDKWTLEGALPIKVMNGINGTNGTWIASGGESINAYSSVSYNVKKVMDLIQEAKESVLNQQSF